MTTYAEFQEYYTRLMWRVGDLDFEEDLPRLIKKAEKRIGRDLSSNAVMGADLIAITDGDSIPLPGDAGELVTVEIVTSNGATLLKPLEVSKFLERTLALQGIMDTTFYSRAGQSIGTNMGLTAADNAAARILYYSNPIPYDTDPVDPFYDQFPDFYEAAVNVQAYEYLKDFELSAEYNSRYQELLSSMIRDSEYVRFPSGQIAVQLPGNVM